MKWFRTTPTEFPTIPEHARVVVLIGGGGVLGKSLIAHKPENVYVVNITKSSTLVGTNVVTYHFDVATEAEKAIRFLATKINCIDVLINAAFISHYSHIETLTENEFHEEFLLNTFAPIHLAQLCITHFWSPRSAEENQCRARKVINISSGAGFGKTKRPELASYAGTKAALNIMTQYLQDYTKKYGVSAHIVAPGSLTDEALLSRTVTAIWTLESKNILEFSQEKIYAVE